MYCRMVFPSFISSYGELLLNFHDLAMVVVCGICATIVPTFWLALTSPPTRTNLEHELLETTWTLVPICVLVGLAVPSLQLLYTIETPVRVYSTLVAEGHQWYWNYKVGVNAAFDSYLLGSSPRLLNVATVPIGGVGRLSAIITSADVLHSFALPAVGVKADAVPGRLNRLSIAPLSPGLYLGQCSELCGVNHSFIPTRYEVR